jgi:hypothetical protein
VYWHFSQTGDQYLGRILALLDPNKPEFGTLPPHWKMVDPCSNEDIKEALQLCYGPILSSQPQETGKLLRGLASIVYHAKYITTVAQVDPRHAFNKIYLLQKPELLERLAALVTLEPTPGVMERPTGIPPHVEQGIMLRDLLLKITDVLITLRSQTSSMVEAISDAIDKKTWESGHMTGPQLQETLNGFRIQIGKDVEAQLMEIKDAIAAAANSSVPPAPKANVPGANNMAGCIFMSGGRFFDVPADFQFPEKLTIHQALRFWLQGKNMTPDGKVWVKPFRKLKRDMLPSMKLQNEYTMNWKPLFSVLEASLEELPIDTRTMSETEIDTAYHTCLDFLKSRAGYCFVKPKTKPEAWSIATWGKRIRRSEIEKKGTAEDKAHLVARTKRNNPKPVIRGLENVPVQNLNSGLKYIFIQAICPWAYATVLKTPHSVF